MRFVLLVLLTLIWLPVFAAEFKMCRSLGKTSMLRILGSKVSRYPSFYAKRARDYADGEWLIDAPIAEVWRAYTQTPPLKMWRSKTISYAFSMFGGRWPGMSKGLRFYLNIDGGVMGAVCPMGMGMEVTDIVPEKSIKLGYLGFSPAFGEQWITFEERGRQTLVRHRTRYLGKNYLIDSLYMSVHQEAIPALHQGVQEFVRRN